MGLSKILTFASVSNFFTTRRTYENMVREKISEAKKEREKGDYHKALDYLTEAQKICDDHGITGNITQEIIGLNVAYHHLAARSNNYSTG